MDEPAASLDPISTAALEDSIINMKGERTVVVVTHDIPEARRIADYVLFMYMGEVIEAGFAEQVLSDPQMPLTKNYLQGHLLVENPAATSLAASVQIY